MSDGSTFVSTHCWANNVCQFDLSLSFPFEFDQQRASGFGRQRASWPSKNAFVFVDEGNCTNNGEEVQPQVCVAGLSQRKFSVNDLQVQENCSHEPISRLGAGSVTQAKVGRTS